ncbi:endonuclease III domain-containing protein [Spirochaetota bacterium]
MLKKYKPQGWWPIINNQTFQSEYHVGAPSNGDDVFEICIGAILTQGVSWENANKSLILLKKSGHFSPNGLLSLSNEELGNLIRSTGYFNQKAKKIKNFINWAEKYNFPNLNIIKKDLHQLRNELLKINGIGPETADSILLYALSKKIFVIDAYTIRIFKRIGIITGKEKYEKIQGLFHDNFNGNINDYREYHALIVAHCKVSCRTIKQLKKKNSCIVCSLNNICKQNI